ncbi:DUF397 domain-containing protein [Streptosporangium sp. NBC_01469]|uniref:DUF397 domain-containing protein n=1 Tax=Streptosporangium sp. NBC_01469 TaxID=2903898 RepID=UPI002E27AF7A|nr:DUF397 domain-containing protein [Streptosporangium sp. NBC_01469]
MGHTQPDLTWRKASLSSAEGQNCVEVAALPGGEQAVRDSKNPSGPVLRFTPGQWNSFIRGVKDGEFD